ncbi:MAG: hypothetical protein Q9168_002987 [Polycauliona sp. 1 TL-2023]
MYSFLLACLAVLRVCAARPAQDAAGQLGSNPSTGFPIEDIPTPAVLQNASGTLQLPLNPNHERYLSVRSRWKPTSTSSPNRARLAMSLAIEIYWYWRMDHDPFITQLSRRQGEAPFEEFWYQVTPDASLGTSLTTRKLGIAYCWVLAYVVGLQEVASADLTAQIDEVGRRIGSIDITSITVRENSTAASMFQPSYNALERLFWANETFNSVLSPGSPIDTLQMLPADMERRWFGCVNAMLGYIIQHPTSGLVATDLPPTPSSPTPKTYRFWRFPRDPRIQDYLEVTVFVPAATRFMTWKTLAEELLLMGSAVALGHAYDYIGTVRDGTTVLAMLKITVNGGAVGGNFKNATDTATS